RVAVRARSDGESHEADDDRRPLRHARRSRATGCGHGHRVRRSGQGPLMPIPVETLLKRVPRDTLRRVEQVKSRFNTTIRRLLREETALKLSGGGEADDRASVPVRLARGLPRALAGRSLDDDTGLAVALAPHQHTLRRLRENLDVLEPALSLLAQR